MKQKLQELLSEKFKGTRKDTLARLATAYSLQCTTEEEAQALVEKLQLNQVTEFEKEYRSEVDSEISKAVNTAKGKGKEGEGNPSAGEENKTDPTDIASIVANAIKEATSPLVQEINSIKAGKTAETRLQQLEGILSDVNPELKAKTLKDFSRMAFDDDSKFTEYLEETKTDIQALNQSFVNQGLANHRPFNGGAGAGSALSEDDYLNMV